MYKLKGNINTNIFFIRKVMDKGFDVHLSYCSMAVYANFAEIVKIEEDYKDEAYEIFTGNSKLSWFISNNNINKFRLKFYKDDVELSANEIKLLIGKN